jgi:hypothetical protein
MACCLNQSLKLRQVRQNGRYDKPNWRNITMRFQVFPNPMHDHQRIACGPIAELLQEFIKDVVVSCDTAVGIREKVFEKSRSLGQEVSPSHEVPQSLTYEIWHHEHTFE